MCRICGVKAGEPYPGMHSRPMDEPAVLNVHHIIDRSEIPNGGSVLSNGITLCEIHHEEAEAHHDLDPEADDAFCPSKLFSIIDSSYEQAMKDAENL